MSKRKTKRQSERKTEREKERLRNREQTRARDKDFPKRNQFKQILLNGFVIYKILSIPNLLFQVRLDPHATSES